MTIKDLKDLEKTIKLCRKTGIQSIKIGDVEFHLGYQEKPQRRMKEVPSEKVNAISPGGITDETQIPTITIPNDSLTEEQLLHWSSEQVTQ